MATITEDYVSFETAKLLKEKGFNAKCNKCYAYFADDDIRCLNLKYPKSAQLLIANRYPCITLQMACKWLREVHGIFITIEIKGDPRKEDFIYYKWSVAKFNGNQITRIDNGLHAPEDYWVAECEEGEDYNKSCETAIKYCLENLI